MIKLSLRFVRCQLSYDTQIINENPNIKYSGVSLYNPDIEIKKDILYVYVSGEMPQVCDGLIVIGNISQMSSCTCPVLWIKEKRDIIKVFDAVFSVFQRFSAWSTEVVSVISQRRPLYEVMQLLNQVTKNPWYLTDSCFRSCVMKEDSLAMETSAYWRYQYYHGHMAFDTIYKLISSGDMTRMNQTGSAIIFHKTSAFNNPFVSKTIISETGIIGHLFIIGMYNDLSCYEVELAEFFGNVITALLDYDVDSTVVSRGFYDFFFIDLIEGNEVKSAETDILFHALNWHEDDEYVVCAVGTSGFRQEQLSTITVYEIEEMLPCKAFVYEEQVIFIVNQRKLGKSDMEKTLKRVSRKCGGSIGYSDTFKEIQQLSIYYRQAVLAVEYASEKQRLISYAEICVSHMLEQALKGMTTAFMMHPAVKLLETYDKQNHTDFLKTLYIYLKNERRTQETVKELFIHRNSLLYRLERIQEITRFQMADYRERLRMLISCEVYFGMQHGHCDLKAAEEENS